VTPSCFVSSSLTDFVNICINFLVFVADILRENTSYVRSFRCTLGIGISYVLPLILCIPTYTAISITKREIIENQTRYTLYHTDLSDMFKANNTLLKVNFWIYAVIIKLLPLLHPDSHKLLVDPHRVQREETETSPAQLRLLSFDGNRNEEARSFEN
jgi:hypothetical protein